MRSWQRRFRCSVAHSLNAMVAVRSPLASIVCARRQGLAWGHCRCCVSQVFERAHAQRGLFSCAVSAAGVAQEVKCSAVRSLAQLVAVGLELVGLDLGFPL